MLLALQCSPHIFKLRRSETWLEHLSVINDWEQFTTYMALLDAVSYDPRITTNIATIKPVHYRRGRPHIDIFPVEKHRPRKLSQACIHKKAYRIHTKKCVPLDIAKHEKLPHTHAPKHISVAFQSFWSVMFQLAGAVMETPAVGCNELNEILTKNKNKATIFARPATGIRCAMDVSSEIRLISIQRCGFFIFSLYSLTLPRSICIGAFPLISYGMKTVPRKKVWRAK